MVGIKVEVRVRRWARGQTQGEAEFLLPRTEKALAPVATRAMFCHHRPGRFGLGGRRVLACQLQLG